MWLLLQCFNHRTHTFTSTGRYTRARGDNEVGPRWYHRYSTSTSLHTRYFNWTWGKYEWQETQHYTAVHTRQISTLTHSSTHSFVKYKANILTLGPAWCRGKPLEHRPGEWDKVHPPPYSALHALSLFGTPTDSLLLRQGHYKQRSFHTTVGFQFSDSSNNKQCMYSRPPSWSLFSHLPGPSFRRTVLQSPNLLRFGCGRFPDSAHNITHFQ